jgi:hypothetical protein
MKPTAALAAAAIATGFFGLARAEDPAPVDVDVGGSVNLCKQRLAPCVASTYSCRSSAIARLEYAAAGVELKGIAPGTTVCTVVGFDKSRSVLSVTVKGTAPRKDTAAR